MRAWPVAIVLALGCGSPAPVSGPATARGTATEPAPAAPEPIALADLPQLEGRPIWDARWDRQTEGPRRAHLAAARFVAAPVDRDIPWYDSPLMDLGTELAHLANAPDPRTRLFATATLGAVLDHQIDGTRDQLERAWRGEVEILAQNIHRFAAAAVVAYRACAEVAPAAPEVMRGWQAACEARAAALESLGAEIEDTYRNSDTRIDTPPPPIRWPAPTGRLPDPEAADAVAVIADVGLPAGVDVATALDRIREVIAGDGAALIPSADIERAGTLAARGQWRESGPRGEVPTSATAILADRYPRVVVGRVRTLCSARRCRLSVFFERLGTRDQSGLPGPYHWMLDSGRPEPAAWLEAAGSLIAHPKEPNTPPSPATSLHGSMGDPVVVHQLDDPWLATPQIVERQAGRALLICGEPWSAYDVSLRVTPRGRPEDVRVRPRKPDASGAAKAARCVTERIESLRWPCPRSGHATGVDFTLRVMPR